MKKYSFQKLFIRLLDAGLSSAKLAEMSGVSPASIHRLKQGKVIKLESLIKICNTLQCELHDIMDISEK